MSSWAIATIAVWGVVQAIKARHGITTDKHGNDSFATRSDPETQREIEELRERIKVLEQITVDDRQARAIADEIESLRDK